MLDPTEEDEASMPIDLRALFSVRMYRKDEIPFDLNSYESRVKHGVWRAEEVEIDDTALIIVFSSK